MTKSESSKKRILVIEDEPILGLLALPRSLFGFVLTFVSCSMDQSLKNRWNLITAFS